jgi:UDP-glucose 4-epimerase
VGEETALGAAWNEASACSPADAYGASKRAAELALARIAGLSYCALRAPLVYGPNVKANFLRLLTAVARGIPLPLGAAVQRRSLLFSGNLAAAISRALDSSACGVFMIRDGEDLSTAELVTRMGLALGRPARLVHISPVLLRGTARWLGRETDIKRLFGRLEVDDARLRATLGWTPPYSVDQGLAATVQWYRQRQR